MDNPLWIWLVFCTLLGACVGSFLNVVILRLPAGMSVISPPSHDMETGRKLAWWENIPVLSYLLLRGRSRHSGKPLSMQYPLIEALTAGLFGGWFAWCYLTNFQPALSGPGLGSTWPIFAAQLFLIAGLLAATVIDARYFVIPLSICWWVTGLGLLLPVVAWFWPAAIAAVPVPSDVLFRSEAMAAIDLPWRYAAAVREAVGRGESQAVVTMLPWVGDGWIMAAMLGAIGLAASVLLLQLGFLHRSFESDVPVVEGEAEDESTGANEAAADATKSDREEDPSTWWVHPHPRREVLKEVVFLAPPMLGFLVGALVFGDLLADTPWALRVLAGVLVGYLVGGGTVWLVRILGTLGFGKEAMGLGDVHLMAAVGAVCGWRVAVLAFFVAPFFGLGYTFLAVGIGRMLNREVKVIPYGPHLAVATVVVLAAREPLLGWFAMRMGGW